MTREEFISDMPKGFKYIADLGETIARYNPDGTITLTDAFSVIMNRPEKSCWRMKKLMVS